jgi:hypothetical protein
MVCGCMCEYCLCVHTPLCDSIATFRMEAHCLSVSLSLSQTDTYTHWKTGSSGEEVSFLPLPKQEDPDKAFVYKYCAWAGAKCSVDFLPFLNLQSQPSCICFLFPGPGMFVCTSLFKTRWFMWNYSSRIPLCLPTPATNGRRDGGDMTGLHLPECKAGLAKINTLLPNAVMTYKRLGWRSPWVPKHLAEGWGSVVPIGRIHQGGPEVTVVMMLVTVMGIFLCQSEELYKECTVFCWTHFSFISGYECKKGKPRIILVTFILSIFVA